MTQQEFEKRFPIQEQECNWCGKKWQDRHPNVPGSLTWCGECVREEFEPDRLQQDEGGY